MPRNDGDGKVDNSATCDAQLAATGLAPDFVKALGICQTSTGSKWGVTSVTFANGFGDDAGAPNDAQHGILSKFGSIIAPREGLAFGVLSSGVGREYDDLTATSCGGPDGGSGPPCFKGVQPHMGDGANVPQGYPKTVLGCGHPGGLTFDGIALTMQIRVPKNARGFQFDFDFWSGEWPEFVCSDYNDGFIAWLQSAAFSGNAGDFNLSFDGAGHPISVNNSFFDRCTPGTWQGCQQTDAGLSACPGGPNELNGTGFDDPGVYCGTSQSTGGGATGWLTTTAPVSPGEVITLQLMIWDTGDHNWDSSVLLDNFQWLPTTPTVSTQRAP